jgi:DNA mismatch repair ATPase MutS
MIQLDDNDILRRYLTKFSQKKKFTGTMLIGTYNVLYDLLYYTELIIDTTIDTVTAKNLELVLNTTNSHTRNTLLGILDRTLTPMGKRLLRMNILQPPCCIDVIKDRLDAIEELSNSEESIFNIQSCLKQLSDLDYTIAYLVKVPNNISTKKSITAVQHAEMKVNQIITLKQAVKCIQDIATRLPQKIQNHSSDNNEIQNEEEEEKQILLRTIYKVH